MGRCHGCVDQLIRSSQHAAAEVMQQGGRIDFE